MGLKRILKIWTEGIRARAGATNKSEQIKRSKDEMIRTFREKVVVLRTRII